MPSSSLKYDLEHKHYHTRSAGVGLTASKAAGLRLKAARLAAGFGDGDDMRLLADYRYTGIEPMRWARMEGGHIEMEPEKQAQVATLFGVTVHYLQGRCDSFGRLCNSHPDKLEAALPPWMKLRGERLVSNAAKLNALLALAGRPFTDVEVAAMMNDRSVIDVKEMLVERRDWSETGNAVMQSVPASEPVATRLEMLCLRYHLIHQHGVDAAACLPELGSDFSPVEKLLAGKRQKQADKESATNASERTPIDFLEERLKAMKSYYRLKAGGTLPPAWEAEAEALLQAVRDGKVKPASNGRFSAERVSRKVNTLLKARRQPLVLFVQDLLGEPYVAGILPTEGTLRNLLGASRAHRGSGSLELCPVVALAVKLQVTAVELVSAAKL